MKVENLRGSKWGFAHETITKEGKDEIVRHFLKTTVCYKNENGENAESFSRIRMDDSFFQIAENKNEKKSFNSFEDFGANSRMSIKNILRDGSFDMDANQREGTINNKQHVEWKIIPAFEGAASDNDKRVLVLGGYHGDSIWFDRRGSQNAQGRSVIVAYSQAYDKPDNEQEAAEKKRIIKEVQFAALLDDGDCVAYRIKSNGRQFVVIVRNINGNVRSETKTPYAWKNELITRGVIKLSFDNKRVAPKKVIKEEVAADEVPVASNGGDKPNGKSEEGQEA